MSNYPERDASYRNNPAWLEKELAQQSLQELLRLKGEFDSMDMADDMAMAQMVSQLSSLAAAIKPT